MKSWQTTVNSACHSLGSVRLLPCDVFENHARSKWQEVAGAKSTRSTLCHCALSCAIPCSRKPLVAGFYLGLKAPWQMHGRKIHWALQRCCCFSRNTKHWKLSKHSKEDEHYMLACSSDLLQACVVGYWNPEQMVIWPGLVWDFSSWEQRPIYCQEKHLKAGIAVSFSTVLAS